LVKEVLKQFFGVNHSSFRCIDSLKEDKRLDMLEFLSPDVQNTLSLVYGGK